MPADNFVELKSIKDIDGCVECVITFRTRDNGERLFSFSFMRSFDQNGISRRTCWLNSRHAPAVLRLTPIALAEIERAEAEYKKGRA